MKTKQTTVETWLTARDRSSLLHKKSDVLFGGQKKKDFIVFTARTVEEALKHLNEAEHIDAIWLDHYLLGAEDGIDFVTIIKNGEGKWKKIPIFVVSNTASDEKVQSYIRLGVNKYYIKVEHKLEDLAREVELSIEHPEE